MKYKSIKINAILNIIKKCVNIIIPLIMYPYVSRVLGASVYGKYSFAESIMGYVGLAAGFGISTYAIREGAIIRDNKKQVKQFASEIFTINMITMVMSLVLLFVMVVAVPKIRGSKTLILIMSFEVIFNTLSRDWLNEVYEDYIYITLRYIFSQILSVISILMFVKTPDDIVIYTILRGIAVVGGASVSIFYTRKYAPICFSPLTQIKKHWRALFIFFGCSCASVIYIHSDITILGFLKSDADVGIYSIVSKIYTLVKSMVNAVVLIMIPRAAYYIGNSKVKLYFELIKNAKNILVMIILPVAVGIWCLSSELILVIAGGEYIVGTYALKILAVSLIFAVFSYLYVYGCLIPNGLDKIFFKASVISATINIIVNFIFIPIFGINAAAATTLLAEISMYLITNYYSRKKCITERKGNIYIIVISIIEGIMIYIESIFIRNCFSESVMRILFLVIFGMISYLLILLICIGAFKIDILDAQNKRSCDNE